MVGISYDNISKCAFGGIQFFVAGWNAYPRILFELVLLILIGISFSALVLSHLLRNRKSKSNTDYGKQEGLTTKL